MTGMVHWSSRGKVANRSFRHPSDFPSDIYSRRNAGRIVQYFHKKSIQNMISLCIHFSVTSTATHVPRTLASQRCSANETSHHAKKTTTKFWTESWEYRGPSDTDSIQSFRRFLPTSFRPPSDIAVFLKALAFLPTSFRNRIIFKDAQWKTWIVP